MEGAARLEAFVRRRRALGVCNFVAVVHGHAAGDLAWVPRWLALAAAGGGRASPDDAPVADWTAVVVTDRAPSCRGVPSVCALRLGSAELRTPPLSVAQCAGAPPVRRRPALAELVDGVAAACGGATANPACVVLDTLATVWLDHTLSDVAALVRDVAEGATSACASISFTFVGNAVCRSVIHSAPCCDAPQAGAPCSCSSTPPSLGARPSKR